MPKVTVNKVGTFGGHKDCVYTLEMDSNPKCFYSASGDGMVVKWNLDEPDQGKLIAQVSNSVYSLCYLKSLNYLVVGHNYDGIHLIDLENNVEIKSLSLTKEAIYDIKVANNYLYVACGDGQVHLVDLFTFTLVESISKSNKSARCLDINHELGHLAVGYSDSYVRIFDLFKLNEIKSFEAHDNSVFAVKYSNDGYCLITGSRDAKIKEWEDRKSVV